MAAAGIRNILIANQVVGSLEARAPGRSLSSRRSHSRRGLRSACQGAGCRGPGGRDASGVVVEVNIAMNRAGVEPGEPVVGLGPAGRGVPRPAVRGPHGLGRRRNLAAIRDPESKRARIVDAVGKLTDSADRCRAAGLPVEIVSCGGTGTYWITAALPGVTEVQAGGGIFCDVHYRNDYGVQHEYALSILTTVVSRPTPTRIICDAGWKSMAQQPALPVPQDLGEIKAVKLSAEHTTIELADSEPRARRGEPRRIRGRVLRRDGLPARLPVRNAPGAGRGDLADPGPRDDGVACRTFLPQQERILIKSHKGGTSCRSSAEKWPW